MPNVRASEYHLPTSFGCLLRSGAKLGVNQLQTHLVLTFQEQSFPSEPTFLLPCVWSRFSGSVLRSLSKPCRYSNATLRFHSTIDYRIINKRRRDSHWWIVLLVYVWLTACIVMSGYIYHYSQKFWQNFEDNHKAVAFLKPCRKLGR